MLIFKLCIHFSSVTRLRAKLYFQPDSHGIGVYLFKEDGIDFEILNQFRNSNLFKNTLSEVKYAKMASVAGSSI